jgi:predicted dithiol-disulfide oxidoreductase (DUF899 family)
MPKIQTVSGVDDHPVVSREQWLSARTALLAKEKEFSRQRDELNRLRRELPWVKVAKPYQFDTTAGRKTLADLFENRGQLAVYHFMFAPEWEQGCKHCSYWADHFDPMIVHLNHRDTTFVVISRAPLAKLQAFRQRMGWWFHWVSSFGSDFNYDFNVSFTAKQLEDGSAFYNYKKGQKDHIDREGASVFSRDDRGDVFHTYSTFARGIDLLNGAYNWIDLTPKGRDEGDSPQSWVKFHDRYDL